MTRQELIELGQQIVRPDNLSESEVDALYDTFNRNVPHPDGANLFFFPENYNARTTDLSKYKPTVEEVVDRALGYKPFS